MLRMVSVGVQEIMVAVEEMVVIDSTVIDSAASVSGEFCGGECGLESVGDRENVWIPFTLWSHVSQ